MQPTPYNRLYNLADYAIDNPIEPYNAAQHDSEFDAIETTLDETLSNLLLIQRDDGALRNGIVTPNSLSASARLLISGWNIVGDWAAFTDYDPKDVVEYGGIGYVALVGHTSSSSFAFDLALGYWLAISSFTGYLTPFQFGAAGDGITVDQAAWNLTRSAAAATGQEFYIPACAGFVLTDTPDAIAGQFTMFGSGPFKSRIILRPTAHDKAALKLSNGASRCERVVLRDFAIWSDDTTYTKIALDVYDLSVCNIERVFIYGAGGSGPSAGACWSGSGSIGIRTHGRESTGVKDIEIIADYPIYIAANPNTDPDDGEDMDHWHWENCYLVANGHYIITVADGIGIEETEFDGYQAWVGGTGGFYINDTRAAPIVPSRGLNFKNVRHEQITDAAGYSFNMTFTARIQNVGLERILMAAGGHGITITGFDRMVCDRVTAAMGAGKNSLVTAGVVAKSVLSMRGCIWQGGSTVTLTGLKEINAMAYRSADYAAPSDAVYSGQLIDTRSFAEIMSLADGVAAPSTLTDRAQIYIDSADGDLKIKYSDGTVKTIVVDT